VLVGKPQKTIGSAGAYRTYKLGCCGSLQDIRREHMRNGNFECAQCGDNTWLQPCDLYLLEVQTNGVRLLKLGHSRMLEVRQTKIRGSACSIEVLKVFRFGTKADAHAAERWVLNHADMKLYRIDPGEARTIVASGFTECIRHEAFAAVEYLFSEACDMFNGRTQPRQGGQSQSRCIGTAEQAFSAP